MGATRQVEILEEFASYESRATDDAGDPIGVTHIHMPPWRDRLPSGELGPWFGPSLSRYESEIRDYEATTAGGGLWDPAEDYPRECRSLVTGQSKPSRQVANVDRYDATAMAAYVTRHSERIPLGELKVYYHFWRDGKSASKTAAALGLSKRTIETWILRLRKRMKACQRCKPTRRPPS